jgi:hypothetical protein
MIKRYRKILICAAVIIIAVIGGLYMKKEFAIRKSIENYHAAEDSEKNEDYHKAYELYSLVIPDDLANFKKAREKINELDKRFETNKMAALGFKLLKEANEIRNFDELSDVKVNVEQNQMTCKINGIGYLIWKEKGVNDIYRKTIATKSKEYTIIKFEAEKQYNGWLSADINMLAQETSSTYFEMAELGTSDTLISKKLIQEYIKEDEKVQ